MKETTDYKVSRIDRELQEQKQSFLTHKSLFENEMKHVDKRMTDIENDLDSLPVHSCLNSTRIDDIRLSITENERSIKKLYIWLSGVGIALLMFFLTMGVASIRYVDKLDYAVQRTTEIAQRNTGYTERLEQRLEQRLEKEEEEKQIFKDALKEALSCTPYYTSRSN